MSTRAHIQFINKNESVTIFHHWDGYPEGDHGIIALLDEFFKTQKHLAAPSFTAVNFIFFCKIRSIVKHNKKHIEWNEPEEVISLENILADGGSHVHDSHAIIDSSSNECDYAYFYDVIMDNKVTVNVRSSKGCNILETHKVG
jgi:hypothetical protein